MTAFYFLYFASSRSYLKIKISSQLFRWERIAEWFRTARFYKMMQSNTIKPRQILIKYHWKNYLNRFIKGCSHKYCHSWKRGNNNNNNNNNNTCFYIAPFQLWGLLKALYRVSLPQRPLHSRDMQCSPYCQPWLSAETKFPSVLHRTSRSHGGLHIARFRLLLGGQVTLGGKTGITTLSPVGFEPATSRTAAERTNHSTTDAT